MTDDRTADQQEMDALLDHLIRFAQQTKSRYGEFHPFGASLNVAGEIRGHAGMLVETDSTPSQTQIELMRAGLRDAAHRGEVVATGICYDVRLKDPQLPQSDAICVELEHASGQAATVYLPYSMPASGEATYGELIAVPLTPTIFSGPSQEPSGSRLSRLAGRLGSRGRS